MGVEGLQFGFAAGLGGGDFGSNDCSEGGQGAALASVSFNHEGAHPGIDVDDEGFGSEGVTRRQAESIGRKFVNVAIHTASPKVDQGLSCREMHDAGFDDEG